MESTGQESRYKFDTPLGEKILRFTTKPPDRFQTKPTGAFCAMQLMQYIKFVSDVFVLATENPLTGSDVTDLGCQLMDGVKAID